MRAIYAITNIATGEQYIGKTYNTAQREHSHRYNLGQGKHPNTRLQAAWDAYGAAAFKFTVLESLSDDYPIIEFEQAEVDWIKRLRPAYNIKLPRPCVGAERYRSGLETT